jgi:hypothetical protein
MEWYHSLNYFFTPFIGLIGAIIGGVLSYFGSVHTHKNQIKEERKTTAKAFKLDIETVEKSPIFNTAYILYSKYPDTPPGRLQCPFYNKETGLYFIYQHEIAKLDLELSRKITNFYDNLIVAENYRSFIAQNPDFIEQEDGERIVKCYYMKKMIIKCGDKIPELKEELEKVQNH